MADKKSPNTDKKAPITDKALLKLARALDREHQRTNDMATEYALALREFQVNWLQKLTKQIEKSARAKKSLQDKMKQVNPKTWQAQRTHTVGCITFGLHKVPGGVVIANESQTIDRVFALVDEGKIAQEVADALIQTKYILRKKAAAQLPPEIMALTGIKEVPGGEALYIHGEEASNIERLLKGLQKSSQQETKARKATALENVGNREI